MRRPSSMRGLENFGRTRLSPNFFVRDFMISEISAFHGIPNIPDNPDLAIERGRAFCETLLEPLHATFGQVTVRSGYRSAALNTFGNENNLNCARSDNPIECHIWDMPEHVVAGASIVIPWFADQYSQGRDWRDLAWWVHDHLPYSEMWFFPKLAAFNLVWRPVPRRTISSYVAPRGMLLRSGAEPAEDVDARAARYADFPHLQGITPL
ncbi:hypothetical protein [Sulfitobacter guttiformis]|uniref:Peptidase M15-like protein n=1 Tax=Sulfitobacter guttiformis TaxID=74349 RepID=A0A420DJU2_9RHOB|nr:hypothetical protein [Sulfitobacter guttiformis]KIN71689.1 hypothetical protein Z949_852 [Sulfitobacter guttiformis KCTC 32187]RKE94484.1 hypothetical protein C8N30_3612 [Sulfitobacter guttiformis]